MTTKKPSGDELLTHVLGTVDHLHKALGQLARGVQTIQATQRQGANRQPINTDPAKAIVAGRVSGSAGRLLGMTMRETGNAGAVIRLLDGSDATGELIAVLVLAKGTSDALSLPAAGVAFVRGLFLDISGTVEGAVYTGPAA